jgi:2-keto-4-pentenoate hydratase/2-oxohepta-3-ene-1,7-dioic acid hydratase in catechol pathway
MKIFAIGMNYAAHNQELHGTLKRPDEPVIFTKADSAILNQGKPFFIPDHL